MIGVWILTFWVPSTLALIPGTVDAPHQTTKGSSSPSTPVVMDTLQVLGEHDYDFGYRMQGAPGWKDWMGYEASRGQDFADSRIALMFDPVAGTPPAYGTDLVDLRSQHSDDGYSIRVGILRSKALGYRNVGYSLVVDEIDTTLIQCRGRPHKPQHLRLDQDDLDRITRGASSASPKFVRWLGSKSFLLSMSGATLVITRQDTGLYEFAFSPRFYLDYE